VASATLLNVPTVSSSANLAALAEGGAEPGQQRGHVRQPSSTTDFSAMQRQGSGTLMGRPNGGTGGAAMAPAVSHADMTMLRPAMLQK
jgi:hypothetical protein